MSYPHQDPYQQDNVRGMIPPSPDSSNSDAVQVANLMSLVMTEGLLVRFSHLFKLATIHWRVARCPPADHRLPARHSPLIPMERGKTGNVSDSRD